MTVNLLLPVIVGQPLKVRVFVTLCAPIVIKSYSSKVTDDLSEFSKKFSSLIQKKMDKKNIGNSETRPAKSKNVIPIVILNALSGFSKKISSLIPKKVNKINHEDSEIKDSSLKSGIPKIFGTIHSKILSFSSTLRNKKNKIGNGKPFLQSDKKENASKFSKADKVSGFEIDKIVESKQDELDFDDNLLTQMSTSSSMKNNNAVSSNSDLTFDKSEFAVGFEALNNEASEDDSFFDVSSEKIILADDSDDLMNSLKKDLVIKKEVSINFMSKMQGENLDLTVIKSELQDVLKKLKKYNEYSNHKY